MPIQDSARPRQYAGLFDGSNEAEKIFVRELPVVTSFVNSQLKAKGYKFTLTKGEIAINFITEGGFIPLSKNLLENLSAFEYFGVDNYLGMRQQYRRWVPSEVDALANNPNKTSSQKNEKNEQCSTLDALTLREGLYLNAGVFAYHAAIASKDIPKFEDLPRPARFFWATIYYNSGCGSGRKLFLRHGVNYYKENWVGAFNNRAPLFNALWRMRSLAHLFSQLPEYEE